MERDEEVSPCPQQPDLTEGVILREGTVASLTFGSPSMSPDPKREEEAKSGHSFLSFLQGVCVEYM